MYFITEFLDYFYNVGSRLRGPTFEKILLFEQKVGPIGRNPTLVLIIKFNPEPLRSCPTGRPDPELIDSLGNDIIAFTDRPKLGCPLQFPFKQYHCTTY